MTGVQTCALPILHDFSPKQNDVSQTMKNNFIESGVMFEFLSFNKHQLLGLKANSRGFAGMSEKMCAKMT